MVASHPLTSRQMRERDEALRQIGLANPTPVEIYPEDRAEPVVLRHRGDRFGSVHVLRTELGNIHCSRPADLARDDTEPQISLTFQSSGSWRLGQYDRQVLVGPGTVVPSSSTSPRTMRFPTRCETRSIIVPEGRIGLPFGVLRGQMARAIPSSHPLVPVLTEQTRTLSEVGPDLLDEHRAAIEYSVTELVRALLATCAGDEVSGRCSSNEVLEMRVMHHLRAHLMEQHLAADSIAAGLGISRRTVYVVLNRLGIELRDWVRTERLEAAARALGRRGNARVAIGAIARESCFPDHATFSRAFKRHFGLSPTEWRDAEVADGADVRAAEG